ncbi:MAG: hypothetical protein CVU05_11575, partial [Bacteroidetes bacterium HGW-Bacteroidetes-21]
MKYLIIIYRCLLQLRYRVKISGIDLVQAPGTKFFLSNHQAIVDPQITFCFLRKYIRVVPVVSELYTKAPVLKQILNSYGTIPVADPSSGKRDTSVLQSITENVCKGLEEGKHVILYPSGQLSVDGTERIINKKSAWTIVGKLPENTRVIGVRIDGLWGSMWSKAKNGKTPSFFGTYLKGIGLALLNLIFFLPRRKVTIDF